MRGKLRVAGGVAGCPGVHAGACGDSPARVKGAHRPYGYLLALICAFSCIASADGLTVSAPIHQHALGSPSQDALSRVIATESVTEQEGNVAAHPITFTGLKGSLGGFLELYGPNEDPEITASFMEVDKAVIKNGKAAEGTARRHPKDRRPAHPFATAAGTTFSVGMGIINSFIKNPVRSHQPNVRPNSPQFKPQKKFTFRDVNLDLADTHLDLRDRDGVIRGRFTMTDDDGYTLALLTTLNQREHTACNVKWVPVSKGKNKSEGHIHFECNAKVPAVGYSGQIPIAIEVTGLSKNKVHNIYLNTDGYNFRREFEDLDHIRHAILVSLGIDFDHQIKITKVNGRRYHDDSGAYQAIMNAVESGSKSIKLTVEPMIRLEANVQEPYSPTSENFNHELGNISVDDYLKTLKDRKRLTKMARDNLGEDANGFTLVGINDLHEGSKGFDGNNPYKMPIEIDEKWTFMPDVTVRFHYLDSFLTSKAFPVHTPLSKVVNVGRDIVKKERGGKDKNAYRVYAYSLPGCPLEEPDVYEMMKARKHITITQLPFNETCFNRRTHVVDFFYLNSKPANYTFDVELTNPDGTRTKPKRITVKYVDDTDLAVLKDAIVSAFEKDGYLITPEDLKFVNVTRADGGELSDRTRILNLADIPKEQMMGHVSHVTMEADPHLVGYFTEPSGKHDTFEFRLPTTKPTASDIRKNFENELRVRNLLKPEEALHTSLKFHPLDNKHKVRMNMFVNPDEGGYFPPGTKLRDMAAEADSRYEFPVKFTNDDGKVHRFAVHAPYGANEHQIEDLIGDEIQRHKYGDRPHEMFIRIKGREGDGLDGLWDGKLDDGLELDVEPARLVDIGGVIDDIPTKFAMKIHPHEGRDELERSIRQGLMREPELARRFQENPNHLNDVSTLIINDHGDPYSDEDFAENDIYNNVRKVRIGVSDHPLSLVWHDPLTGKDTPFCFSKTAEGGCRGAPVHILAKFNVHHLADLLRNKIRAEDRELSAEIASLPRKDAQLTSNMKLGEVVLVGGQRLPTPDIQQSDSVAMVEHLYGVPLSHLTSLVFSLMTRKELQHQQDRLGGGPRTIRLSMNKRGGEPESHVVMADDMGPAELRNLINKHFRGVDGGSQLEGLTINGEDYKNQPLSYFVDKMADKHMPLKLEFGVADDVKHGGVPSIMDVRIQPKYNETLRSYFERAMEEPGDFGLSPMHSYVVECLNEAGERIHVPKLLDRPLSSLSACKELRVRAKEQGRSHEPGRVFAMEPDQKMDLHTTITLDEKKDSTSNLNRQLRNFLMDLPETELDHVTVMIDDKPVKCSLASLREAYQIRNLTVDTLLSLCNMDSRKADRSVFKLQLNPSEGGGGGQAGKPGGAKGGHGGRKSSVDLDGTPLCYFTLHKGQHDVGVGSTVPITLGTLKSPLKEFNTKLAAMFGETLAQIGNIRLSVVRNGELEPCRAERKVRNLADFRKVTLQAIFQMCGIPVAIPEDNTFYHFRLSIPFGEDMTYTSGVSMGGSMPVEMLYKDDDEFSTMHYNEDLRVPLYDFLNQQPDVDMGHLDRYMLRVKGENPGGETVSRSYKLDHLPADMSPATIFPHTPMTNLVFQVADTDDPYNSTGGWRTGMSYPVNDYRNNFDAIKQQLILNLKAMHGNALSKLNGYNVVVTINGQKHQCRIKSLADLERMDFEEFSRSCVNIEHIQNNPSMHFNVAYESGRGDPEINLTCVCGDYDTIQVHNLSPGDVIPQAAIDQLTQKYSAQRLGDVQWGIMINGMQGNCHLDNITSPLYLSEILENCGVDDIHSRHFDITLHDLAVDHRYVVKVASSNGNGGQAGQGGNGNNAGQYVTGVSVTGQPGTGKPVAGQPVAGQAANGIFDTSKLGTVQPGTGNLNGTVRLSANGEPQYGFAPLFSVDNHTLYPPTEFADVHPNIFVNMPQEYNGPQINVNGRKSVNDYVREIVMDEDEAAPGTPMNIRVNTNGHNFNLNDIPLDDLNYPVDYINGNVSINVRPDPSGSIPGTVRTFHLPDTDKPLSSYLTMLRKRIPDMGDKRLMLVGNKTMLDEDRIPLHLLNKPMNELRKAGFVVSLMNDPHDYQPSGAINVNILSRDGFSSNASINDLQEPLRDVFAKMGVDGVDLRSLAGARFKVIIDGIEKTCNLPTLDRLLTSVSVQEILSTCGIRDFNHSHDFTLYFDRLLGGENGNHRSPFKLEVDLDNDVESTRNVDYSADVQLSDGALDFLKTKPNSHIFFDMEGKGFREFVEVDTEKFRQLLKAHPSVVDLLLRMGVPQEHLGGVDCLKIILSTLSQLLQGHQQYSVNNGGSDSAFSLDDPIGKYQSILDVAAVLKERPEQDVTVTVELANGNVKDFIIPNREFLHALSGNLSFKNVALWGLSQAEANQITHIHFNTAPFGGVPEELPEDALGRGPSPVRKGAPTPPYPPASNARRPPGPANNPAAPPLPQASPAKKRTSLNAGVITPDTLLSAVPVISKAMQDNDRNVMFAVGLRGGETLEILVKNSLLKDNSQHGAKIVDLLSHFMPLEDLSRIASVSVQLVSDSRRFFVPLKNHAPVVMPIMAADHPQQCEIQEFKNPWNPPESMYRRMTLGEAIGGYRAHYKIRPNMPTKAAYLLRKEMGNNISAELLFDEEHPADKQTLQRKIGSAIDSGSTLFVRFKSSGELAI
ncbi:DUF5007 domain-containing protein [Babesia caballi]|uniref:DUF5007 domain-containing protein n=1 Tax=Babesia caballi TaxID=5871 RepID=A0AAV4LWD7_BABCB|nr:DUF5007 domain-containing protein [Babesia caballi]